MNKAEQRKLFGQLQNEFEKNGYETVIQEEEEILSLKVLVNMLGEKEVGAAILELSFAQEKELGSLQNLNVVQFFVTFDQKVNDKKMTEILNALNQINLTCALGSFQIFDEEDQLYFKYNAIVSGEGEDCIYTMIPVINWIIAMLEDCYDSMSAMVQGDF